MYCNTSTTRSTLMASQRLSQAQLGEQLTQSGSWVPPSQIPSKRRRIINNAYHREFFLHTPRTVNISQQIMGYFHRSMVERKKSHLPSELSPPPQHCLKVDEKTDPLKPYSTTTVEIRSVVGEQGIMFWFPFWPQSIWRFLHKPFWLMTAVLSRNITIPV